MKKKDYGVIVAVVVFSSVFSYFISGILISAPEDRRQTVEVVEPLSAEFALPDNKYFNSQSVNPAKDIQIGQDPDSKPFEGR